MRFLIDECLNARLADLLAAAGYDCAHVGQRSLLGAADEDVMAVAASESRILISADTDFGELLAASNTALPSVIPLRRSGRLPESQAPVVLQNLPAVEDDLLAGAIVVITDDRIRVRRLPIFPSAG